MPGGGGSTPDTPDYIGAAQATAQGNLDLSKYTTQANRINQITPYGSLTYTNGRTFDQAGYEAALAAYRTQEQNAGTTTGGHWDTQQSGGGDAGTNYSQVWVPEQTSRTSAGLTLPDPSNYYSGDANNWTQTTTLSPEMQSLYNQQMQLSQGLFGAQNAALGRVNQTMGQGFDSSSIPGQGTVLDVNGLPQAGSVLNPNSIQMGSVYDPNQATNTATDALLSRINPELDRQSDQLRTQLANQGIAQGSAAYNNALGSFGQQRNDAVTQAGLQGITLGMQQQGQTYNQTAQNAALQAALQGQSFNQSTQNRSLAAALQGQSFNQATTNNTNGFSQAAYERSLPLQELNALRSGSQVQMPQFPGYASQGQTSGADILSATGAQYQSQLNAANAGQAQQSGMLGGIGGLLGTGIGAYMGGGSGAMLGGGLGSSLGGMFSDRRLKKDIRPVGRSRNGLMLYSYRYLWDKTRTVGHMAHEVAKKFPDAVSYMGGLAMVDYSKVA